jgi:hypothetical protein
MVDKSIKLLEDPSFRQQHGMFSTIAENFSFIASNPKNQRSRDSINWVAPYMKTLRKYGRQCEHITEFGVNQVNSTYAFLASKPKKLVSVDIDLNRRPSQYVPAFKGVNLWLEWAKVLAEREGVIFQPIEADDASIDIETTDLLFIDSKHSENHLRKELNRHKNKVRKYIIFHDTTLFGGQLMPPIQELLSERSFEIVEHIKESPGLMVIRRVI